MINSSVPNHKSFQKRFANTAFVILAIILTSIVGYFVWDNRSATPKGWQFIDTHSFTVSVPWEWGFYESSGIDSYIGGFGAELNFDFGYFSNPLAKDNDPNHVVTYETIGGYRAKIVIPKVTGNGTTGIYFGDIRGEKFTVCGENLTSSQQETALKIFHTIGFKK